MLTLFSGIRVDKLTCMPRRTFVNTLMFRKVPNWVYVRGRKEKLGKRGQEISLHKNALQGVTYGGKIFR